ncbi:MAG: tetratricopeptide repeat protein [Planctomycetota bacterium]|jgi:tetratricopeptide (TPR) repeat protein|nr:tetratricopeptide repeat protein [Planctomycetota bacterium]
MTSAGLPVLLLGVLLNLSSASTDEAFEEARRLRRAGEAAEAAEVLRAQLQNHLNDGDYIGLLGLCLLDSGATAEADALLREQGASIEDSFRLEILRGRLAQAHNDMSAAEEAYREATRLNGQAVEAWVLRVRANMSSQRMGKALKNSQRLEAVNPELGRSLSAEILKAQGDGYRRMGIATIELAADKYVAALEKTPENDALANLVLETQLSAMRTEEVAELVAARFEGEEHALARHYWTGRGSATAQQNEAAREAFLAALDLDSEHADSALWMAKLSLADGQPDAARSWLERCSSAGLSTAQTELLMGEVLTELGDLEAAESHLRAAADRDPNFTKALYLLGRLLMRTGQTDEAREVLARFQELSAPPPLLDDGR